MEKWMLILFMVIAASVVFVNADDHFFTGLPMTGDGWTDYQAMIQSGYDDSRVIFVSSSGDDSTANTYVITDLTFDTNGMFQPAGTINAYSTISAGFSQIRDGYPDILLLERGDVWDEYFSSGSVGDWSKSGRSQTERIILSSYGQGDRPTLNTGDDSGIDIDDIDFLIVSGIHIYSDSWASGNSARAIDVLGESADIIFEDCIFERNLNRVQGYGGIHNRIAFRRNHFIEGNLGDLGASIYASETTDLLIEENVFSHPETKNRHLYMSPTGTDDDHSLKGLILKGNIFHYSERSGLSVRSGGEIDNNLFLQNDQVLVGGWGGSGGSIQSAYISNNVFLESSITAGDGEFSIRLINIDGGEVKDNIWTDNTNLGTSSYAVKFSGDEGVYIAKNIEIRDNIIHDWAGGPVDGRGIHYPGGFEVDNVVITNNDIQMVSGSDDLISHSGSFNGFTYSDNTYYTTASNWFNPGGTFENWVSQSGETGAEAVQVTYPDSARTLKTYGVSLGGNPSTQDFIDKALEQARHSWDSDYTAPAVNNYIRAGFGREPISNEYPVQSCSVQGYFCCSSCKPGTEQPSYDCQTQVCCGSCAVDCVNDADIAPCDGCVDTSELSAYINSWKSGSVEINELMVVIGIWKNGCD